MIMPRVCSTRADANGKGDLHRPGKWDGVRYSFRPYTYAAIVFAIVLTACGGPITTTPVPGTSLGAAPAVSPGSGALNGTGSTTTFAVTGAGAFTAASSNAAIATVTLTSPTSFTVTAGASAGVATIAVTGANGDITTVAVTVTIVSGNVN
jgi:hypothetical protein